MVRAAFLLTLLFAVPVLGAEIRLPVWAVGDNDVPELGLQRKHFNAALDDHETRVKSVQGPGSNLILLVVMDVVGDLSRIDAALNTLQERLDSLGREWFVALMQAQDGLHVLQDPTRNRKKLAEKLRAMPTNGYPGLLDAVDEAAGIAQSMLDGSEVRVAVLFITDGGIEDYRGDYTNPVVNPSDSGDLSRRFRDRVIQEKVSALSDRLASISTPLFFLHLNENRDTLNVAYQNGISQFARDTGGQAAFARDVTTIPSLLEGLLNRINDHYCVTLEMPDQTQGRLRVRLDAGSRARLEHKETLELVPAAER